MNIFLKNTLKLANWLGGLKTSALNNRCAQAVQLKITFDFI